MTRDPCAVCGKQGERRCPSLDQRLCSRCCGTHRGRFVRCPSSCAYYRTAEEKLRERRARELDRAWAVWYRELVSSGEERIFTYVEALAKTLALLLHREAAPDAEVEAALRHLDRSLSPVVLVSTAPPPLGQMLAEDLLLPFVRDGKADGERLRKAAQALSSWLSTYRSPDDPLKFVRGLLGTFPPPPAEAQGLIVLPREPA
ncbi:TPA: hypothetical protein DCY65_00140 [Candidatus Acetothermia bacterium]|nr:hypothetical protein [Candidatus Acetothermia bacterium]HAZ29972.1 hypothetical protein [Candidatus Acetothermia bacterium]